MFRKSALILATLSLLTACGGGGGGGGIGIPSAYVGSTSKAVVTQSNAKALSIDAYTGGQTTYAVSGVGKETAGAQTSARLQVITGILGSSVQTAMEGTKLTAKSVAQTVSNTVTGASGSMSYTIDLNQASGVFSGSMTFSSFKDYSYSPQVSGTISFAGTYSQSLDTFTSFTITAENIHVTESTQSYTLSGAITYSYSGNTRTVTMNAVMTNGASNKSFWLNNVVVTTTGNSLTISGRYYDPTHGYVDITTITPLTISTVYLAPTSGQLLCTGNNGTKVRLTFTSSGYTVEVDVTGNGTYVTVP